MHAATQRQSQLARQQDEIPLLRPSMLSKDERFIGILKFAATLPTRAQIVVDDLEKYQRSYRLDSTLLDVLKLAKRTAAKRHRSFH